MIIPLFMLAYTALQAIDNYAIVFDAGSSGTRMYVFKYQLDLSVSASYPTNIQQLEYYKLGDNGIDKLQNENDVKSLFQVAFEKAEALIPPEHHANTFLALAATAGMRLLEISKPGETERLFALIRDQFRKTKFLFPDPSQVRVISGSDESTDEWIGVNYLFNNFDMPTKSSSDTYGILHLGGSSTQITFVPKNENAIQHVHRLMINGKSYNPYSYSYLCWGSDRFYNFYQVNILKKNEFAKLFTGECYPQGYTVDVTAESLINPCTTGTALEGIYDFTVTETEIKKEAVYTLQGSSNYEKCVQDIDFLVPKRDCGLSSCGFNGIYQPLTANSVFKASGDYYDAYSMTEDLMNTKIDGNITKFQELTKTICKSTYDELIFINKQNGSGLKSKLHFMCIQNLYTFELFKSLGINDLTNVEFINKIDENKVGWTLGYLINELSK